MNGGDIDVIFTADDKDVSAGLDRMTKKAGGWKAEMLKAGDKVKEQFTSFKNLGPAAGAAVGSAFALAGKAVNDYAEKNDLVAGSLDALRRASAEVWTSIGRDISAGGIGPVVDFIKTVDGARVGVVNFVAGLFNDDVEGVDKAMKDTEKMIAAEKERKTIKQESLRMEADLLAAQGKTLESAIKRAQMEKDATLERINSMGLSGGKDKNRLMQLADEKFRADVASAREKDAADRQKRIDDTLSKDEATDKAEQARIREQRELIENKRIAQERLDIEIASAELEATKGSMTKEQVVRAEKELELRKKIMDLSQNDLLTSEAKSAAIEKFRALSEVEMASALAKKPDKAREFIAVASGINVSGGALSAARGGATLTVATQTRDAAMRTAKAVEKIADYGVSAVYQ